MGCISPCSKRNKVTRRTWRFVFFGLAILAGFAAGLGYGWGINPVQYSSTSPDSLRVDYQTDLVLMIAELYQAEGDLALALARLDFLGEAPPVETVNRAIDYGETHGYALADLARMRNLAADIHLALGGIN